MELKNTEVLEIVKDITSQEHHFNRIEADYRKLASQWLMAVFAGLGFVLREGTGLLPAEKAVLMGFILLAGATGIFLLWLLDIRVYHRLLHSVFVRGHELEKQHDWLPKVRTAMIESVKGGDVTGTVVYYYSIMFCGLVLLAGSCFAYFSFRLVQGSSSLGSWFVGGGVMLGFIGAATIGFWWMKRCSTPDMLK